MTDTTAAETSAISKGRAWGTPFKPGESGNPSGRPPGFSAMVRDKTLDGRTLVEQAIKLLKGNAVNGLKPSPELSFRALEWLADRGWGRAVRNVDVAGRIVHTWDMLDGLELESVKALALAYRALQEQKAQAIEGEVRVIETSEDVSIDK